MQIFVDNNGVPVTGLIEDFKWGKKKKKREKKGLARNSNLSTAFTALSRHHSRSWFSYFHFLNNFHSKMPQ